MERRSWLGRLVMASARASATTSAVWPPGRCTSITKRLLRSTRVATVLEGVRAAGVPAGGRGQGGLRRGAAGAGLGRSGRPVHHRGQDDGAPPAGQARRPAHHSDRPRGRIPDRRAVMHPIRKAFTAIRLHWRTLRLQLALLYAGAFVALGAALLAVSGLLVRSGSVSVTGSSTSQNAFVGHHFNVGP